MSSMFILFVVFDIAFIIAISAQNTSYDAIIGESKLPRSDDTIAVGHNSNTSEIILVGGLVNQKQLFTFNPDTNTFEDMGRTYSDVYIQGSTQYYTQIDDTLWIINKNGTSFITLNTKTLEITQTNIIFPESVGVKQGNQIAEKACLAAYDSWLFVVGGSNGTVSIYDTINNIWITDELTLQTPRNRASCAISDDSLYVIGGVVANDSSHRLDSIEVFDLETFNLSESSIGHNDSVFTSYVMNETLDTVLSHSYALAYGENQIIIVGGYDGSEYISDIQIIDTLMETVTVRGQLAYAAIYTAPIIVDTVLYIFGGYSTAKGLLNTWQYVSLDGLIMTDAPTISVTDMVSTAGMVPTMAPSGVDDLQTTMDGNGEGKDKKEGSKIALIVFGVVTVSAFIGIAIILIARRRRKEQGIVVYDSAQNLLNNEMGSNANYDLL